MGVIVPADKAKVEQGGREGQAVDKLVHIVCGTEVKRHTETGETEIVVIDSVIINLIIFGWFVKVFS